MLLLGCLWQAGFAAVHAAPSAEAATGLHRQPSALRLPRDVEALLNAAHAAHAAAVRAVGADALASTTLPYFEAARRSGVGGRVGAAVPPLRLPGMGGATAAEPTGGKAVSQQLLQVPFRRLLAVIEASSELRAAYPHGGAVWAAFVRVQQLATAALGALLQALPAVEASFVQHGGLQALLPSLTDVEAPPPPPTDPGGGSVGSAGSGGGGGGDMGGALRALRLGSARRLLQQRRCQARRQQRSS